MLFRTEFLEGVRAGRVTLAFRRWRRPTVRAGGTLLTPIGELGIAAVDRVPEASISEEDAVRAGFASRAVLLAELNRRSKGDIYRIALGSLRADPRLALRERAELGESELRTVLERLRRLDHAAAEPWTARTLGIIAAHEGIRAGDLARTCGQEREAFKLNVRKLKALRLTESLDVGYRLSPRGETVLQALRDVRAQRK